MTQPDKKLYCKYCRGEIEANSPYCRECFKDLEEYHDFKELKAYVNELYEKEQK